MIKGTNLDYIPHIQKLLLISNTNDRYGDIPPVYIIHLTNIVYYIMNLLIEWSKTTFGNIFIIFTAIYYMVRHH